MSLWNGLFGLGNVTEEEMQRQMAMQMQALPNSGFDTPRDQLKRSLQLLTQIAHLMTNEEVQQVNSIAMNATGRLGMQEANPPIPFMG